MTYNTSPTKRDTDEDGLIDGAEVDEYGTDPTAADTDGDGLSDGEEVITYGTNPTLKDTDGDGISDAIEVEEGTDPLDPSDPPKTTSVPEFIIEIGFLTSLFLVGLVLLTLRRQRKP